MNNRKVKIEDTSVNLSFCSVTRDREYEDVEMKSGELEYHLRQLLEAGKLTYAIPGCYCDGQFCMGDNLQLRLLSSRTPYWNGSGLQFPVEGVMAQHQYVTSSGLVSYDCSRMLSPQFPLLTVILWRRNGIPKEQTWQNDRINELYKFYSPSFYRGERLPPVPFIKMSSVTGGNNELYELYDSNGIVAYRAKVISTENGIAVIPFRFYRHVESGAEFALPFFPKEPAFFGCPPRTDSPRQTVYLSDAIEIVLANPRRVLGLLFDIDQEISLERLKGHECNWLLDAQADRDSYQRLLLFLDRCRKAGLSVEIKKYNKQESSSWSTPCVSGCEFSRGLLSLESFSLDEFVREASERGCRIPDGLCLDRNGRIDFPSLPETQTLIADLLDSDDVILVEEMQKVPLHCFARWLVQACSTGKSLFQHFPLSRKFRVLLFVTEGEERAVAEEAGDGVKVYHPDFYAATSGIDIFKEIVSETNPDIAVFDVESLAATKNKDVFLLALADCKHHGIGIVVVWSHDLLGDDVSSWLCSKAQRRAYFMALPGTGYVYEEFSDAHPRFKIDLDGREVEEELSAAELESIPGRDKLVGQAR
ncbi:hypothetical protein SDC9_92294 [bioreactor metagenome]|uniref:Uncharacterized protein n=1 Tax=bioreactor metagenome TaxID=1076179 RepID=A0A644ZY20_9ZZZZ